MTSNLCSLRSARRLVIAAIGIAVSSCATVHAYQDAPSPLATFGSIVKFCRSKDPTQSLICSTYITGFVAGVHSTIDDLSAEAVAGRMVKGEVAPLDPALDAAMVKERRERQRVVGFCVDRIWTAAFVAAVMDQYARENPDSLKDDAPDHMNKVLARAFPCPAK